MRVGRKEFPPPKCLNGIVTWFESTSHQSPVRFLDSLVCHHTHGTSMSDAIAQDTTPHPRQGTRRRAANGDSDASSDEDQISSRPHSRQSGKGRDTATTSKASGGGLPSIFGHHRHYNKTHKEGDPDSDDSMDEHGHKRGRRRRIAESASHLLAQAPAIPDLRFDSTYRKALGQIYDTHAQECALAQASDNIAATGSSQLQQQHRARAAAVPSITARISVMTLRDIIIMPFISGFAWGFGTIMLTLATQRSLAYHVRRTWRSIFGGSEDNGPVNIRGGPARVRRVGNTGLGGLGLLSAGSSPRSGSGGGEPFIN